MSLGPLAPFTKTIQLAERSRSRAAHTSVRSKLDRFKRSSLKRVRQICHAWLDARCGLAVEESENLTVRIEMDWIPDRGMKDSTHW
jgi:hypothetical protein